jgi:hypothetical protein
MTMHTPTQAKNSVWFRLSLLAATVLLSSCGTPFVYKAAEGPDVATVRLRNASGSWVRAMESHKGDCTDMWFFGDNKENIHSGAARVTTVAPGTFLVLNVVGNVGVGAGTGAAGSFSVSSCTFNVGFVAEPHASYELTYGGSAGACTLRATAQTSAGIRQLPLTKMDLKNLFGPQTCVRAGS